MERVKFVSHRGKDILLLDFSNCSSQEALVTIKGATKVVETALECSLLILVNVEDAYFNSEVVDATKSLVAHDRPYVKKEAIVGMKGIQEVVYDAVIRVLGSSSSSLGDIEKAKESLPRFDDIEKAKDWLVND